MIYSDVEQTVFSDGLSEFFKVFEVIPIAFGHQKKDPRAWCKDRITGSFEIVFVLSGDSLITIQDKRYRVEPSQMVIIPPFVRHSIETSAQNPHDNFWLHFDIIPFYKQQELLRSLIRGEEYCFSVGEKEIVQRIFESLEREMQSCEQGKFVMAALLIKQLLLHLARDGQQGGHAFFVHCEEKHTLLRAITQYMEEHIADSIQAQDICREFGLSRSGFYKLFRELVGMSPTDFLMRIRLRKAEIMLKAQNKTISQISDELGFSNPYYFSKCFKDSYKKSPKAYRQEFKKNQNYMFYDQW